MLFGAGYFHCLSGVVWAGGLCGRTADAGDRRAKGVGGDGYEYCHTFVEGFFGAGGDFGSDRFSVVLVVYASLAAGICVPDIDWLVRFCVGGVDGYADCFADGEPAGDQGGDGESGEEFEI